MLMLFLIDYSIYLKTNLISLSTTTNKSTTTNFVQDKVQITKF